MADIFLSYAREDEARAAAVERALREHGWSVFFDCRIPAGQTWDDVLDRELNVCKCVVVLWSAASTTSRWVRTEAHFGLQRNTLVPVNLDQIEPPFAFRFLESAQLHSWSGAVDDPELSVLVDGIAHHVPLASQKPQPSPTAEAAVSNPPVPQPPLERPRDSQIPGVTTSPAPQPPFDSSTVGDVADVVIEGGIKDKAPRVPRVSQQASRPTARSAPTPAASRPRPTSSAPQEIERATRRAASVPTTAPLAPEQRSVPPLASGAARGIARDVVSSEGLAFPTAAKHAGVWLGLVAAGELFSAMTSSPFLGTVVVFAGAGIFSTISYESASSRPLTGRQTTMIWASWLAGSIVVPWFAPLYASVYFSHTLVGEGAPFIAVLLGICGIATGLIVGDAKPFALGWVPASVLLAMIGLAIAPDGYQDWLVISRGLVLLTAMATFATTTATMAASRAHQEGAFPEVPILDSPWKHAVAWIALVIAAELASLFYNTVLPGILVAFGGAGILSTIDAASLFPERGRIHTRAMVWACWLAGALLVPAVTNVLMGAPLAADGYFQSFYFSRADLSHYLMLGSFSIAAAILLGCCGTVTGILLGQPGIFALNWGLASVVLAVLPPLTAPDNYGDWVLISRGLAILAAAGCFATARCELGTGRVQSTDSADPAAVSD